MSLKIELKVQKFLPQAKGVRMCSFCAGVTRASLVLQSHLPMQHIVPSPRTAKERFLITKFNSQEVLFKIRDIV